VRLRKVSFAKLPDINDVAIQNKGCGLNTAQILNKLVGMAAKCAEVHITDNDQLN
jgi:hypothetical protein